MNDWMNEKTSANSLICLRPSPSPVNLSPPSLAICDAVFLSQLETELFKPYPIPVPLLHHPIMTTTNNFHSCPNSIPPAFLPNFWPCMETNQATWLLKTSFGAWYEMTEMVVGWWCSADSAGWWFEQLQWGNNELIVKLWHMVLPIIIPGHKLLFTFSLTYLEVYT